MPLAATEQSRVPSDRAEWPALAQGLRRDVLASVATHNRVGSIRPGSRTRSTQSELGPTQRLEMTVPSGICSVLVIPPHVPWVRTDDVTKAIVRPYRTRIRLSSAVSANVRDVPNRHFGDTLGNGELERYGHSPLAEQLDRA